jgi:ParB family transcriptional regulator, chromosome partitioning protein
VTKKRGLGRGLDALIGAMGTGREAEAPAQDATALDLIDGDLTQRGRFQPRRDFNPEALDELANSIRAQGIMQPIVIRPLGGDRYEIIAGERRWRAAQIAGLGEVPVVVRDVPDEAAVAMALIENIQRADLNAIEEAGALQRLQQEFGLTHEQIATAVGKSRAAVTNSLRLLTLTSEVREMLEQHRLEMGHARALLSLPAEQQTSIGREIINRRLSVRATEALVRRLLATRSRSVKQSAAPNADIRQLERELSERTGAVVSIEHKSGGQGRLVVRYASLDQLDGILRFFRG